MEPYATISLTGQQAELSLSKPTAENERYNYRMRVMLALLCASLMVVPSLDAQTRKTTPKKAPAKITRKVPAPVLSRSVCG